jgi:DDE superfamily endonuclease
VLLTWDDKGCLGSYPFQFEEYFDMNATGWSRGLEVTGGGGTDVLSYAGLMLLRELADRTGLTAGLPAALPSPAWGHDRGRVFADLACAIADGARVISDFRVVSHQRELLGPVASVPTAWRALKEAAADGDRTRRKVTAAVNRALRHGWGQAGPLLPVRIADRQLEGVVCIRLVRRVPCQNSSVAVDQQLSLLTTIVEFTEGAARTGRKTAHLGRQWLSRYGKTDSGVVTVTTVWADGRPCYPVHAVPYTRPGTSPGARKTRNSGPSWRSARTWRFKPKTRGSPSAQSSDSGYGDQNGFRAELAEVGLPFVMALRPRRGTWARAEDVYTPVEAP